MAYLCKDQKVHSQLYAYQIPAFNLVSDEFKGLQNWNFTFMEVLRSETILFDLSFL